MCRCVLHDIICIISLLQIAVDPVVHNTSTIVTIYYYCLKIEGWCHLDESSMHRTFLLLVKQASFTVSHLLT